MAVWDESPLSGAIIALDRAVCALRDPETLRTNAIPSRYSADLEPDGFGTAWCGSLFLKAAKR